MIYAWEKLETFRIQGTGSRGYTLTKNSPCRITGERGIWRVVSAERHVEDGRVNVEVVKADKGRSVRSRTFPSSRIRYVRPTSVAAQKALTRECVEA